MNKFLNFIVGAVLAVSTSFAFAQDFKLERVGLHLGSVHIPNSGSNNFNPGVYASFSAFGIDKLAAGCYRNSQKHNSCYLAKAFETNLDANWTAGILLGGVTGYRKEWYERVEYTTTTTIKIDDKTFTSKEHWFYHEKHEKKYHLLPLVSPTLTRKIDKNFYTRLSIIPGGLKKGHKTAIHGSIEISFY